MNDYFIWNGKKCTEFGIHVSEQPSITLPAERATFTNVQGRSGALTALEGDMVYDDMVLTATCLIADPSRIPDIAAWLHGGGKVTFANRQGGFYYARVVNQIPFDRILRGNPHRSFAVNFRCKPFWYQSDVQKQVFTQSASTLVNPGNAYSEPVITVYGTGEIALMVGQFIVELTGVSGSVTIDSELQEAYSGHTAMNHAMSGDFPHLLPGSNAISWTGDVERVEILPNWRYL